MKNRFIALMAFLILSTMMVACTAEPIAPTESILESSTTPISSAPSVEDTELEENPFDEQFIKDLTENPFDEQLIKELKENFEDIHALTKLPEVEDINFDDFVVKTLEIIDMGEYTVLELPTNDSEETIAVILKNYITVLTINTTLGETSLPLAEVEFLNDEQKDTVQKASDLLGKLSVGAMTLGTGDKHKGGYFNCINPDFESYDDFMKYAFSLVTAEYWEEQYGHCALDVDGELYLHSGGRGGDASYIHDSDIYELISKTEDRIEFYTVGHYNNFIGESDTYPEYTFTKNILNVMENTEQGWRLSKSAITY